VLTLTLQLFGLWQRCTVAYHLHSIPYRSKNRLYIQLPLKESFSINLKMLRTMLPKKQTINLTGILIKDSNDRGFTAYFAEFPEAIADGKTENEAESNLIDAFKIMLETRKHENSEEQTPFGNIIEKNIEFELQ
jgi:predicted RNase H-like HicB family nuclease